MSTTLEALKIHNDNQLENIQKIKENNEVNVLIKLKNNLKLDNAQFTLHREVTNFGIRNSKLYNLQNNKTLEIFSNMILKNIDKVINDTDFSINISIKKCKVKDLDANRVNYKIKKFDYIDKEGKQNKYINVSLFLFKE